MALDPVLQELVDKAAMRDLMARYSRGADGRDPDLIASTFASDAYTDYSGWDGRGRDNIVSWIMRPSASHFRSTHFMGDQLVQISGDTAEVETYAGGFEVRDVDGTPSVVITGLRYVDKMVRQNGQWLVQHRVLHHDCRGNAPAGTSSIADQEFWIPSIEKEESEGAIGIVNGTPRRVTDRTDFPFAAVMNCDGQRALVHISNSGRLRELLTPDNVMCLTPADPSSNRKTAYNLTLVGVGDVLVSADATAPNALLAEALEDGQVDEFTGEEVLPWLCLKGISTGAMQVALEALLGAEAKGLSPAFTEFTPEAPPR